MAQISARNGGFLADTNYLLFERHAFRKHAQEQERRGILNASLWDVMSTGLSRYSREQVEAQADPFREAFYALLDNEKFNTSITYGPNDPRKVQSRFEAAGNMIKEVLGAPTD